LSRSAPTPPRAPPTGPAGRTPPLAGAPTPPSGHTRTSRGDVNGPAVRAVVHRLCEASGTHARPRLPHGLWYTAPVIRRHALARAAFRIALRTLKWGTLVVALLVAGVWVGGRHTAFLLCKNIDGCDYSVSGHPGGFQVACVPPIEPPVNLTLVYYLGHDIGDYDDLGPIWMPNIEGLSGPDLVIQIPYWLPILLLASTSGGLFWRDRRASRRATAGDCPSCGYSRAGLALDAVCPECGKAKV